MGFATGHDLHVDSILSQIAINHRPSGFIWDQIAPIVPVAKQTDGYPVFSRGEAFSIENDLRAPRTEANRVTRSVSTATYQAKNYALAMDTAVEDRANMDAAFQFELDAGTTRYLTWKLWLNADRRILPKAVAGVGTTFLTGSSWIAASNAGDPVSQISQSIEVIQSTTAQRPNSLIFGWRAWNYFRRNVNARNAILGVNNGGGFIKRQQAQELFEVDRFLVAEAFYNPANENQTAVYSNAFPHDAVMVYYAPLQASREDPSFMYSFRWTASELGVPFAAQRHEFDTRKKADGIEVGYYQAEEITGGAFGAILTGVGSAQANGLT